MTYTHHMAVLYGAFHYEPNFILYEPNFIGRFVVTLIGRTYKRTCINVYKQFLNV